MRCDGLAMNDRAIALVSGETIERILLLKVAGHDAITMDLCKDRCSRNANAESIAVDNGCVMRRMGPEPIAIDEQMTLFKGLTKARNAVVDRSVHCIERGLKDVHPVNVLRRTGPHGPCPGRGFDRFGQVCSLLRSQFF